MRSTTLLIMTVALAMLAAIWAMWGARPAKAIIIIGGGKTGTFTVGQSEAVRVYVVNTGGEVAIIDDGDIFDIAGNSLMKISTLRVEPEKGTLLFDFKPGLADQERLPLRVEVRFETDTSRSRGANLRFTAEVYETATGKTNFLLGQDFIIDDGK
jgi:hypothetical protein